MSQVKKIKCSSKRMALISAYDLGIATLEDLAELKRLGEQEAAAAQWEECSEQDAAWYEKVGFEVKR